MAVRLNLLGLPGEAPDFVVASWVLPYVYALRGDRDWRRTPQLTGSRQVSQLAVEAYKLLEAGDTTLSKLTRALGREVTEVAVLRAITELWQQLRIIPVVSAPGEHVQWQLLRTRFQKAIAEGASTSQVTAISVLASIYLQAVIAAGMEEVELFLAPLTARSKVREVLRGLVTTRQVHTISLGHAPLFYVAGTLPEFAVAPTIYSVSSMPANAYFLRLHEVEEEELPEAAGAKQFTVEISAAAASSKLEESQKARPSVARKPSTPAKPAPARTHFSRPATHSRDRKPSQPSSTSRPARRASADTRPSSARSASPARWSPKAAAETNGKRNPAHKGVASGNGNGAKEIVRPASRPANGGSASRSAKSAAPAWSRGNGRSNSVKAVGKSSGPSRGARKPALAGGAKAGSSKRYGFAARPKQETKKRG